MTDGAPSRPPWLVGRGVPLPRVGLGGAALGNLGRPVTDEDAEALLAAAWAAGIRYFDTAPHYGLGLSESRLGRFLRARPRDEVVLSTKVGRLLEDGGGERRDDEGFAVTSRLVRRRDYTRDGVLRSLEASLARLGVDRVDVVLIHDPDEHWREAVEEAYPCLHDLREQGVVGAIGVGMNQWEMPAAFVHETDIDCVLLAGRYTLLDRGAGDELLPLCRERGVAVIAGGVFNSGLLARPDPSATFDYGPAPAALVQRALRMAEVCRRYGLALPDAALAFPLRHPAVSGVLLGVRSTAQLAQNLASLDRDVPAALWAEVETLA